MGMVGAVVNAIYSGPLLVKKHDEFLVDDVQKLLRVKALGNSCLVGDDDSLKAQLIDELNACGCSPLKTNPIRMVQIARLFVNSAISIYEDCFVVHCLFL